MARSTKKKAILSGSIAFLLLLVGCFVFFSARKDIAYRLKTNVQAAFAPSFELTEAETDTEPVSLEELLGDPRCMRDQSLLLVNTTHPLKDGFSPEVAPYRDTDVLMNVCVQESYAALSQRIDELFGEKLYIRSAYRTEEEQRNEVETNAENATQVGASEHQAGLALDVYVPYYAGSAFLKTETGRYVNAHCSEFGFIIRYPSFGESVTGIAFEPWHLRYVGFPHAEIIAEHFLTLEEYVEMLEVGAVYRYGMYYITRQAGESFTVPTTYEHAVISEDNTGAYILTFKIE